MIKMETATTEGIEVIVTANFRPDLSHCERGSFFHNYHIELENHNRFPVQLIHRDWYIFDSLEDANYVSGAGVIGEQPILKPGERFTYTSGCELTSELGFMSGFYTFLNLESGKTFKVNVPQFHLVYPPKLN